MYNVFAAYAMFAFLSTFYREIVKDIEDKDGDAVYGAKTLPIVFGVKIAKGFAIMMAIALIYFIGFVIGWEGKFGSNIRVGYAVIFILIP